MFLPGGTVRDAVRMCETIRQDVAALRFPEMDPDVQITCSFGAGEWRTGETVDDSLKRADVALYAAKSGGRNRVIAATGDSQVNSVIVSGLVSGLRRLSQ